jgi:nucleotide-binding universal stress UspA family protein
MSASAIKTATRFETILFATDFSPAAARAIPYVRRIAKRYQSSLVALHVRPPIVNPMTPPGTWPGEVEAAKAIDREHRQEILESFEGIPTDVVIEEGDILTSFSEAIQKNKVDLVVIGTRGRTGLGKLLLGSVAEEVFRNVSCPVLTVGPHAELPQPNGELREILFATDFSPESQGAATIALSLAQEFQARLVLLHVVVPGKPYEMVSWSDVRDSAKELLHKLVPEEAEAWCKPEYFVERGDPAERILDLAKLRCTDLIVLGVQQEKGVPGAATHLPTAIAHKVVSSATCPVLTIRH